MLFARTVAKLIKLFGGKQDQRYSRQLGDSPILAVYRLTRNLATLCDQGHIERIHKEYLTDTVAALEKSSG